MGSCVFVCYRSRTRSTRTIIENPSTFNLQHHVPTINYVPTRSTRTWPLPWQCRAQRNESFANMLLPAHIVSLRHGRSGFFSRRGAPISVTMERLNSQRTSASAKGGYPKGPLCIRVRRRRPRSPRLVEKLPLGPKKKAHKEPPYLGEVYGALEFPRENPSQGIGVDLPRGAIAVKQLVPKA